MSGYALTITWVSIWSSMNYDHVPFLILEYRLEIFLSSNLRPVVGESYSSKALGTILFGNFKNVSLSTKFHIPRAAPSRLSSRTS